MINEFFENKTNIDKKKNLVLVENTGVFISQGLPVIVNFLNSLREDLEYCYKFIINCEPQNLKNLSYFFINNLFENIFSNNFSDELLSVIYRCLENEINNISGPENFLENSNLKILFEGLIINPRIKYFFHLILTPIIEKIENKFHEKLFINIFEIINDFENNIEQYNDNTIFSENNNQEKVNKEFNDKYMSDLSKNDLQNLYEQEKDLFIKEYIKKQIDLYQINNNLYSNSKLIDEIKKSKNSHKIFLIYKNIFLTIKRVIDYIIICLNEKIHLISPSLKIICKMIKILVNKKYENCTLLIENLYIGKFFFKFLICESLESIDYQCLIGSFILSKQTQENFKEIIQILKQLFSFEFFNSENNFSYIPFNSYFLKDILPYISKLFKELTNIKFSPFLEKISQNDNIYYYDFFKENKNELIQVVSYCFNLNELKILFSQAKNLNIEFEEDLDKNEKAKILKLRNKKATLLRFNNYLPEINEIISIEEKDNKVFYFLLPFINFNKQFLQYKKIEKTICYTIKEISLVNNKDELLENNLIKIDNFLVKLLYTYGILNQRDFSEIASNDLIKLLNELIKILKTGRLNFNSSVPPEWYGKSLITLLINLPEKYKKNNYDEILSMLKMKIQESIDFLDPKIFVSIYEKFKYINEKKELLTYVEQCLLEVEQNKKLKFFFENVNIHNILTLNKTSINGKSTFKINSVSNLIEIFPNVTTKEKNGKNKSLVYQKDDFIPQFILNFFNIINDKLKDSQILKESDFKSKYKDYELKKTDLYLKKKNVCLMYDGFYQHLNEYMILNFAIFEKENNSNCDIEFYLKLFKNKLNEFLLSKIETYIMSKLYLRIFPIESSYEDIKLYKQIIKFYWIEPKHIIHEKAIIENNFFEEIILLIQNLDNISSPNAKLNQLSIIFHIIENIINFSLENKNMIVSTQIIPIFVYCLIKSKSKKLWTNLTYIKYYKEDVIQEPIFIQFQVSLTMLQNLKYEDLFDISIDEYEDNCKKILSKK